MTNSCASGTYDYVRSIPELATPPSMISRVVSIVQDESCTALDLASELEGDAGLAAQILRLINAPSCGLQRTVTSIPDAVIVLGFDELERIALTVSVINLFGRDREEAKALGTLWRHGVASATAGQIIEQRNRQCGCEIRGAHLAALLHDIGKAVIMHHFPDAFARIDRLVAAGAPVLDAERDALDGATHADIGAWLVEGWDLPQAVVEGIARHHAAEDAGDHEPVVHATHAANFLAKSVGLGSYLGCDDEPLCPESCDVLGLDTDLANHVASALRRSRFLMGALSRGDMFRPAP